MANLFFHRCGVHHEEYQLFSSPKEFSDQWKRNSLCSKEIRSTNIFCSHGSALLRLINEKVNPASDTHTILLQFQKQLFVIDHQKGGLENYGFENEEAVKTNRKEKLKALNQQYHLICDQNQAILSNEAKFEVVNYPIPNE